MKPIKAAKQGQFGCGRTPAARRDDSCPVGKRAYSVRLHDMD